MNEEESSKVSFPTQFQLAAIGTLVGFVGVLVISLLQLVWDSKVFLLDQPQSLIEYTQFVTLHSTQVLVYYLLDTVFMIGYFSFFIGIWLIIRDFADPLPKIPLLLSIVVFAGDIVENAIHILFIHAVTNDVVLDIQLLYWAWILNLVIDLASYLAAAFFSFILLAIWRPPRLKFVLGSLLLIYLAVGVISLIFPPFLLIRNVVFVFGLAFGAFVLSKEELIPLEDLEDMLRGQRDTQDYIR